MPGGAQTQRPRPRPAWVWGLPGLSRWPHSRYRAGGIHGRVEAVILTLNTRTEASERGTTAKTGYRVWDPSSPQRETERGGGGPPRTGAPPPPGAASHSRSTPRPCRPTRRDSRALGTRGGRRQVPPPYRDGRTLGSLCDSEVFHLTDIKDVCPKRCPRSQSLALPRSTANLRSPGP